MARTDPQINLRIPAQLKERIEQAGSVSGRSTNAEIVYRLELSFSVENVMMGVHEALAQTQENLAKIEDRMSEFYQEKKLFEKKLAAANALLSKKK